MNAKVLAILILIFVPAFGFTVCDNESTSKTNDKVRGQLKANGKKEVVKLNNEITDACECGCDEKDIDDACKYFKYCKDRCQMVYKTLCVDEECASLRCSFHMQCIDSCHYFIKGFKKEKGINDDKNPAVQKLTRIIIADDDYETNGESVNINLNNNINIGNGEYNNNNNNNNGNGENNNGNNNNNGGGDNLNLNSNDNSVTSNIDGSNNKKKGQVIFDDKIKGKYNPDKNKIVVIVHNANDLGNNPELNKYFDSIGNKGGSKTENKGTLKKFAEKYKASKQKFQEKYEKRKQKNKEKKQMIKEKLCILPFCRGKQKKYL